MSIKMIKLGVDYYSIPDDFDIIYCDGTEGYVLHLPNIHIHMSQEEYEDFLDKVDIEVIYEL